MTLHGATKRVTAAVAAFVAVPLVAVMTMAGQDAVANTDTTTTTSTSTSLPCSNNQTQSGHPCATTTTTTSMPTTTTRPPIVIDDPPVVLDLNRVARPIVTVPRFAG